ncbi:type I-E CRISPR-associated protein Cse2/CasB [Balneatrix alpica]|uniref:type I-E CRISPR-associated protein Cse2/CasB n=1 Tax=Balneatrix alpica TaxID=75684 RepID=UPI002739364C|nr:type I-E CRISPR-associated protein Cse2/CasB [Balneatrix alpica]
MPLDAMAIYHAWNALDSGASAQLRRVAEPDDLRDIPAFYRLVQHLGWHNPANQRPLLRVVFCLSAGKHVIRHAEPSEKHPHGISLGKALAVNEKINERRLYQLLRAEWPQDMVQLRRLLIHAEPILHWPTMVEQLTWWNERARRQLLEDFVLAQPQKKTA